MYDQFDDTCMRFRLLQAGVALNMDGGMIKDSADEMLRQSSAYSDPVVVNFCSCNAKSGGRSMGKNHNHECSCQSSAVAGPYIEFVQRSVLPEYRHLSRSELREAHFRDGFEATSANYIFTSTSGVQSHQEQA